MTRRSLFTLCLLFSFASLTFSGFLLLRRYITFPFDPQLTPIVHAEVEEKEPFPVQLVIPSQRIELPIIPSQLKDEQWQITGNGVSLLQTSQPTLKEKGLIIYGHNWKSLLGDLHKAKIGEKITLVYSNGDATQYFIQSIMTVRPTQLDVLDLAKADTLLVYTCTGFLDSQRLVVLAHR